MRYTLTTPLIIFALTFAHLGRADDAQQDGQQNPHTLNNLVWKTGAPTPFHRVESPAAVVDGKLFLFGGFTEDLDGSTEVDVYDPAVDKWSRKKDMPSGMTHLNAVVDGNTIWLAGGFKGHHPGPTSDEVWKYDVVADSWKAGPALPEPRAGGGLALVDGKLHYFGGLTSDRQTTSGSHWSLTLDGGKKWESEADMPEPRGHLAATVLDGKIYALGGTDGHDKTQIDVPMCHAYDPATKKWSAIARLPDGRSHFESSTLIYRGRILVIGGRSNSPEPARGVLNEMITYDPKQNVWQAVGTLTEKVLAPSAAIIGDRVIVTGGGLGNPRPLTAATHVATLPDEK
jgi:N-acetylneuraminic acid mutarotase